MDGFTACPALGDPTGSSRLQAGAKATKPIDAIANPGKQKSPHKAGFFGFLLRRLALPRGLEPLF